MFLIKNGSMRIVNYIRDEKFTIKSMSNILPDEDEVQAVEVSKIVVCWFHGLVQKKVKDIMEILDDDEALENERRNASSLRDRYKGTSNTGGGGYGAYGSDSQSDSSYGNKGFGSEFGGYGSGSGKPKLPSSLNQNSSNFSKPAQGGLYDDYSNKSSNLRARLGIKSTT